MQIIKSNQCVANSKWNGIIKRICATISAQIKKICSVEATSLKTCTETSKQGMNECTYSHMATMPSRAMI